MFLPWFFFFSPSPEIRLLFQPLAWNFLAPVSILWLSFSPFLFPPSLPRINVIYFTIPQANFSGVLGGKNNTTQLAGTWRHSARVTARSEATPSASSMTPDSTVIHCHNKIVSSLRETLSTSCPNIIYGFKCCFIYG